jgi:3-deoxy-D-manno-octulosonic-acid transferase
MDRTRLLDLGLPEDRVSAAGNIKYDIKCTGTPGPGDKRSELGLPWSNEDGPVFVAGSTHKGEEEVIFPVFKALKKEFPALRLVIAPRDPARGKEIAAMARNLELIAGLRSAGPAKTGTDLLILDTLGELKDCYPAADIAFVGGSLVDAGGHNILEPAACGVPVIFGPNMESFRYAADELLSDGAGLCVRDAAGLETAIRTLLKDKDRRMEMGRRAKALIARNSGAAMRYIRLLEKHIKETA